MIDRKELISLYLDNKLSKEEKTSFEKELSSNKLLKEEFNELLSIKKYLNQISSIKTSTNFNAKLSSRIKTIEKNETYSNSKTGFSFIRYLTSIRPIYAMPLTAFFLVFVYYIVSDSPREINVNITKNQEIVVQPSENSFVDSDSSGLNQNDKLRGSTHYTSGSKKGN